MKAANRNEWEEANWLRLIYFARRVNEAFRIFLNRTLIVLNVLLFLTYQIAKGLLLVVKLLLLTEPNLNRIERDETWIFRQIK